jgi:hypothetical protein
MLPDFLPKNSVPWAVSSCALLRGGSVFNRQAKSYESCPESCSEVKDAAKVIGFK